MGRDVVAPQRLLELFLVDGSICNLSLAAALRLIDAVDEIANRTLSPVLREALEVPP
jgi:hypothetical protein